MSGKKVANGRPMGLRYDLHQVGFYFFRMGLSGKPEEAGQSDHMGIHGDPRNAKGIAPYHIGRLPPYTPQGRQLSHRMRHLAIITIDQNLATGLNIHGFIMIKASGKNSLF